MHICNGELNIYRLNTHTYGKNVKNKSGISGRQEADRQHFLLEILFLGIFYAEVSLAEPIYKKIKEKQTSMN